VTGGASLDGGTRRRQTAGPCGVAEGRVRPGAEARNTVSEQATWAEAAQTRRKAIGRLIQDPSGRTDDLQTVLLLF
jgi:hypothetical protein